MIFACVLKTVCCFLIISNTKQANLRKYGFLVDIALTPYFQCDVDIASFALYVVGVQCLGVSSFEYAAFAARFAVVEALPRFLYVCPALLPGRFFCLWRCHKVSFSLVICLFPVLLRLYGKIVVIRVSSRCRRGKSSVWSFLRLCIYSRLL